MNKCLASKYADLNPNQHEIIIDKACQKTYRKCEQGFSLLEVMISVLVLSVGLLGIAGLQSSTVRNTLSAQQRTAAITMATSTAEQIRAFYMMNKNSSLLTYREFNLAKTCETAPSGSDFFAKTRQQLYSDMILNFGQSDKSCIQIDFIAASNSIRISIFWDDSRSTSGESQESLNYEVRVRP
jgi:type IV pilus assembly protein PilV